MASTEVADSTPPVAAAPTTTTQLPKTRLPMDRIGILEDRVAEDPKGDMDGWQSLINEYINRNRLDDARAIFERFLKIFPTAAEQWVAYANLELQNDEFSRVEQIFGRSLMNVPNVPLWSTYLDYIRRRNVLTNDQDGNARQTVHAVFDFVINKIGIDKDSGHIWQDYIAFIKSGPGTVGGTSWQDHQKVDSVRKAYHRALSIPTQATAGMWAEYTAFENTANKMTARKFMQEKMAAYMSAKQGFVALQSITKDLNRSTLPRLPPAPGFEGDVEYQQQLDIWRKWIQWEKDDPLDFKEEGDFKGYRARIIYVYRQVTMSMRFEPAFWYDAAEFCFTNDEEETGDSFLKEGIEANPESCLLAFKQADRIELATTSMGTDEKGLKERGAAIRQPYDKVLAAHYELIKIVEAREKKSISRIQDSFAQQIAQDRQERQQDDDDDDDDDADDDGIKQKEAAERAQIRAVKESSKVQITLLRKTLTYAWIAFIRAMRRVQGKGTPKESEIGGLRGTFYEARKAGHLTSDIYTAVALMEHYCYLDPSAPKLFQRGAALFREDENFAFEYLKYLISVRDVTNARLAFETIVGRLSASPEKVHRTKPLFHFLHQYESNYGDLAQVKKLEQRMRELFPEDPDLRLFSRRYEDINAHGQKFDPTLIRPILSPATQMRPKMPPMPSIERATPAASIPPPSPRPAPPVLGNNSPKRPFVADASDRDFGPPRKLARGESPLKGAAGRRLDAQRRRHGGADAPSIGHAPPPPLPRDLNFLISMLPRAELCAGLQPIHIPAMVQLIRSVDLDRAQGGQYAPPQAHGGGQYGGGGGGYQQGGGGYDGGYGRR
ncbi:Suf-domain-containing protein [Trichodelitschia bisporula]|uniref:mRNA 3'-end-processing protein RNA14 n=1 Tax=Trichodelitschia bisporula TaxID=703511 RepID=A0A6G1HV21_9PEZI|nr:Suf-domain-containing protein [Trichodelitschia bisporula]